MKFSISHVGLLVCFLLAGSWSVHAEEAKQVVRLPDDSLTSGLPGTGAVTVAELEKYLGDAKNHAVLDIELPLGLDVGKNAITGLQANPLTRAKIELGRQLYFDTRLSSDNIISCAACHHPDTGFAAHTQFGVGVRGQQGGRNSPVSYNRILSGAQFWDGRADSLEAQAVGPIANPIEMGNTHAKAVATLQSIPGYKLQFEKIFNDGVTIDNVGRALAAFERVIVTGPSPYDYAERFKPLARLSADDVEEMKTDDAEGYARYVALAEQVKKHPLSESARRGQELFFGQRVNCAACHVGANLADEQYHNLGVGMKAKEPDVGRFAVTKQEKDWGAFKTPTVRNVALSAPYMHDGSLKTLEEVVEHYNIGGIPNKNLSSKIIRLNLTDPEKADLVAFMQACTGSFPKVAQDRLPAEK
jgi:cytochrome c peroxidase